MFSLSTIENQEDLKTFQQMISSEVAECSVHSAKLLPINGFLFTKGSLWYGNVWTDWRNMTHEACNVIILEIFSMFKLEEKDQYFDKNDSEDHQKSICVWTRTDELEEHLYQDDDIISLIANVPPGAPNSRSITHYTKAMSGNIEIFRKHLPRAINYKLENDPFIAWIAKPEHLKHRACPPGYSIREMTVEETMDAHSQWKYKTNESCVRYQCSAKQGLAIGAFCNTSPKNIVSFALLSWDGTIAAVTTLSEHKRRGLAKAVVCVLSQKLIQRCTVPYLFIVKSETSYISENLYRSLGFKIEKNISVYFGALYNSLDIGDSLSI